MSKSIARLLLLTLGVLAKQSSLFAHDGADDHVHSLPAVNVRTWTFTGSNSTIEGSFVAVRDGRVYIRQTDGFVRPVTIDRLAEADRGWVGERTREIEAINTQPEYVLTAQQAKRTTKGRDAASSDPGLPLLQKSFEPFKSTVKTRSDADYFYVESNGVPDHQMMVGITAWQQQVPMPQKYTGSNAWQIRCIQFPRRNRCRRRTTSFEEPSPLP